MLVDPFRAKLLSKLFLSNVTVSHLSLISELQQAPGNFFFKISIEELFLVENCFFNYIEASLLFHLVYSRNISVIACDFRNLAARVFWVGAFSDPSNFSHFFIIERTNFVNVFGEGGCLFGIAAEYFKQFFHLSILHVIVLNVSVEDFDIFYFENELDFFPHCVSISMLPF